MATPIPSTARSVIEYPYRHSNSGRYLKSIPVHANDESKRHEDQRDRVQHLHRFVQPFADARKLHVEHAGQHLAVDVHVVDDVNNV